MNVISLDTSFLKNFISDSEINLLNEKIIECNNMLHNKSGKGNDFLGWIDLPNSISQSLITDINKTADYLRQISEVVIVVGIGGSYLGAKAIIDALTNSFPDNYHKNNPQILFAGNNLSQDYLAELVEYINKKDYSIIVISKSGTTIEPAIAFRILKNHIEKKYGKTESEKRIIAITDREKGALKKIADQNNYKTYVIPDDVGGRYSVLTPVGLVPIATAGIDINKIINGAKHIKNLFDDINSNSISKNIIAKYVAIRNILYSKGKKIEILVAYNPKMSFFIEWWKQLYGESEGKEKKGVFPAGTIFTTDLHSLGQYIQQGERILFETVLSIEKPSKNINIPFDQQNIDNLNYISNKSIDHINKMAELGTIMAHSDGDVPNIKISIPELSEEYIGQLIYFFEKSCALSGYLLNINPFDQPGVEFYKKNMLNLLKNNE